jgi:hypothetical protein
MSDHYSDFRTIVKRVGGKPIYLTCLKFLGK